MAEAGGGEKSELPTPKKRQDARDEGQVAFSSEVNTTGMLLIGFASLAAFGPWFWTAMSTALRRALENDLSLELDDAHRLAHLVAGYVPVALWLAPLLGVFALAGIALSVAQVGWHPTLKPLVPKLDRLNPMTGFSRLLGVRGLVRVLFSMLKLALVIAIAWRLLSRTVPHAVVMGPQVAARFSTECSQLWTLAMTLAAVLAAIAVADFIYQRFQQTRDLMMTKQEVKEEYKQSDGDPLVKGKIRQIQRAMAQKRMMQEVPKADVVITNPTHVAVALKYQKEESDAPIVVAKGYDEVAQKIKQMAAEHGVTMVENVTLARALAKEVDIGKPIPVKWYQAVAEVLAMVYRLKKAA